MAMSNQLHITVATHAAFGPTRWTIVLAARDWRAPQVQAALTELCRSYWCPLYSFIRHRGHSPHEAQDLTQAFFARVFETDALQHVRRERGKFRTFLLTALTNFLNNEWDRQRRLKRGGHCEFVSMDLAEAQTS